MNDPIKIIYKFKNSNNKIQYISLIFVGSLINDQLLKILKKIKELNLYDSLMILNVKELDILNKEYGDEWYKKIFISKHINHTFNKIIKSNPIKKKEIINKLGQEWYDKHIEIYSHLTAITYSYQESFKERMLLKNLNKKNNEIKIEDDISYKTNLIGGYEEIYFFKSKDIYIGEYNKSSCGQEFYMYTKPLTNEFIHNNILVNKEDIQYNAKKTNNKQNDIINTKDDNIIDDDIDNEDYNEPELEETKEEEIDLSSVDEFDMEELENIKEDIIDKNADKVRESIQNVLDKIDNKDVNDIIDNIQKWDNSKDNNLYDEDLINSFYKIYITNQYIYRDDTIVTIKNKICSGYRKNEKIDKESSYFIPSRLYLWSEYEFIDNQENLITDKIMIGQKWIRKTELLTIDIEPNINMRIYETLKGNLKNLQDNIRKYGSKISYENDFYNILDEYNNYMTNNEIYMTDLYNDLGMNYSATEEQIKNVYDVYVRIYYNGINYLEFKEIIDYLDKNNINTQSYQNEVTRINNTMKTIINDLIMENEITNNVEELKIDNKNYKKYFGDNYVTQSTVYLNIRHQNFKNQSRIELFRIFDNFIVNDKYPFVQYQLPDGKLVFKFFSMNTETDKQAIITKWFENAPYGISFKIKSNYESKSSQNKYISLSLTELGKLDYKTQWKEEDKATFEDIKLSYDEIRNIIRKINNENNKLKLEVPLDKKFNFAFINTIQQFYLPEGYLISHNDISDFARYFYPYIAVVVEPRKRQSKIIKKNEKSKYGSYFRYKRVNKYENEANIEKRILYFLRNYEFNEKLLTLEISKQFNIIEKVAYDRIQEVMKKYPNLKKSRNMLKKMDNIPKYKPPGIDINIQGRSKDSYKIRISGARSKHQLDNITSFMYILMYLYIQTYLLKDPTKKNLRDKLISLTNIAKRRNKVDDVVEHDSIIKNIKQITKLDKERLGYKPEKGENQWSRNCQNSGKKKRRPVIYTDKNIDDMIKSGYILNPKTGEYEMKTKIKINGKLQDITTKAVKINNYDGNGNNMFYTCNPKENGEYAYVGFLSKSTNPFGHCMPCCFIKDPAISVNKVKAEFHNKCLGKDIKLDKPTDSKFITDKLYILQDSNKTLDNRFSYLSEYLDIFFNTMLNKSKVIKNNYLVNSNSGFFFKYGIKKDDDKYLSAISNALDISIDEIRNKIIDTLTNHKFKDSIFISLNSGDIATQFKTIDNYINFIKTNFEIEYNLIDDILSIPGIIDDKGINIFIFEQKNYKISYHKYKTKLKEANITDINLNNDFFIIQKNIENIENYLQKDRKTIILIKDEEDYYPIYLAYKKEDSKLIDLHKYFYYNIDKSNIINHIYQYLKVNINKINIGVSNIDNAKNTYNKLLKLKDYNNITNQIIDKRNKVRYLIINNKFIIPTIPSGCIYSIKISKDHSKYLLSFDDTIKYSFDIYNKSNKNINILPIGIFYSNKQDTGGDKYTTDAIIIDRYISIPIKQEILTKDDIKKSVKFIGSKEFIAESHSIYDNIDKFLISDYKHDIIDDRIKYIKLNNYIEESFELFRLEISNFLRDNIDIKNRISRLLKKKLSNDDKIHQIKLILYKIVSNDLYKLYLDSYNNKSIFIDKINDNLIIETDTITTEKSSDDSSDYLDDSDLIPINDNLQQDKIGGQIYTIQEEFLLDDPILYGGKDDDDYSLDDINFGDETRGKLVNIIDENPLNIDKYEIKNNRELCRINQDRNTCNSNPHCSWKHNQCKITLTNESIINGINKIADQLVNNELKSNEILMLEGCYVTDIININNYKVRNDQKIIKSNNNNIKKLLSEMFGKNNIPIIGKRQIKKLSKNINEENLYHPIEKIGQKYYQIIHFNNTIYRAFANSFYWLLSESKDILQRNLGYYSDFQTDLSNYFKSQVIDWITNKRNQLNLLDDLSILYPTKENFINEFKKYLTKSNEIMKNYIIELHILNIIYNIPIIIYDNYDNIICYFNNGLQYIINLYTKSNFNINSIIYDNSIHIKYNITVFSFTNTPSQLTIIYYD